MHIMDWFEGKKAPKSSRCLIYMILIKFTNLTLYFYSFCRKPCQHSHRWCAIFHLRRHWRKCWPKKSPKNRRLWKHSARAMAMLKLVKSPLTWYVRNNSCHCTLYAPYCRYYSYCQFSGAPRTKAKQKKTATVLKFNWMRFQRIYMACAHAL